MIAAIAFFMDVHHGVCSLYSYVVRSFKDAICSYSIIFYLYFPKGQISANALTGPVRYAHIDLKNNTSFYFQKQALKFHNIILRLVSLIYFSVVFLDNNCRRNIHSVDIDFYNTDQFKSFLL